MFFPWKINGCSTGQRTWQTATGVHNRTHTVHRLSESLIITGKVAFAPLTKLCPLNAFLHTMLFPWNQLEHFIYSSLFLLVRGSRAPTVRWQQCAFLFTALLKVTNISIYCMCECSLHMCVCLLISVSLGVSVLN